MLYADYILYSNDGEPNAVVGAPVFTGMGGMRYLAGTCTGETTEEHFAADAGTSCCWVEGEWFATVGIDLTRVLVCFRDARFAEALAAERELEIYALWGVSDT